LNDLLYDRVFMWLLLPILLPALADQVLAQPLVGDALQ
jgi:hypothetical protein